MQSSPFRHLTAQHDPTKCTISEGSPCPACSDLIALDVEISVLVKKRRMIEAGINGLHDPLFHNLPLEIVTQIFTCYVDQSTTPFFIGDWQELDSELPSYAPLILGGVSKAWREAVWATPPLWSSLHIRIKSHTRPSVQLIREWLSRSGQLPLSIRVDSSGIQELPTLYTFLDVLQEYAHRWNILLLSIEPCWYPKLFDDLKGAPALEILHLLPHWCQRPGDPAFTLHNTPCLRHVQLSDVYIRKIHIQWHTITHLKVNNLSGEELWSILQFANGLIKCEVRFLDGDDTTLSVLTLPSLQQFTLHPRESVSSAIVLGRLICPVLNDFTYDSSTEGALAPIDTLFAFCEHSRAEITHLTLTGITNEDQICDENFVRLLANLPLITRLSLSIQDSEEDEEGSVIPLSTTDYLFDALSSQPKTYPSLDPADNFLPCLQVLHLTRATISWQAFLHIFDSYRVGIYLAETGLPVDMSTATPALEPSYSARRPLREVRLFLDSRSFIYIDESVLSPLLQVRESGIQLEVRDKRTDTDLFQASSELYS